MQSMLVVLIMIEYSVLDIIWAWPETGGSTDAELVQFGSKTWYFNPFGFVMNVTSTRHADLRIGVETVETVESSAEARSSWALERTFNDDGCFSMPKYPNLHLLNCIKLPNSAK